ncbi:hypothetical protein BDQ17DRAFT_1425078 [Cyathus striatus]|nr:hypothetical protein BDQ17DRAFT_1425078 [Cyathus striatus]
MSLILVYLDIHYPSLISSPWIPKGIPGDTPQGRKEPKELTIRGNGSTAVEGRSVLSLGGDEHVREECYTSSAILSSPPYHASACTWSTVTTLREAVDNFMPDLYAGRAHMEEGAGCEADVGMREKAANGDKG